MEVLAVSWACGRGREGGGPAASEALAAWDPGASDGWGRSGPSDEADEDGRSAGEAGAQGEEGDHGHSRRHRTRGGGRAETRAVGTGKEGAKDSVLHGHNSGRSKGPQTEEVTGCGLRSNPV